MTITVGAFEAKTKLSELLDKVEQGEEIIITRRGNPVARLASLTKGVGGRTKKASKDELLAIAEKFSSLVKGEFTSADINTILYDEDGLPK
jgi:prevent-host-death family protein